jgi:ElaB/YqjD/DUF883 family membrane-anchored ribosome-binding protein
MSMLLNPDTFYAEALQVSGITPRAPEDFEKIALVTGVDVEVVKLASFFYDELQKDAIPYASEQDRSADAMSLAYAYDTHVKQAEAEADQIVDELAGELMKTAEFFCSANDLDLHPAEAMEIAIEQVKTAANPLFAELEAAGKTAAKRNAKPGYFGQGVNWVKKHPWTSAGIGAGTAGAGLGAYYLLRKQQEDEALAAAELEAAGKTAAKRNAKPGYFGQGVNWVKKHPWTSAGIGAGTAAAGLGAYYLLRKQQEEEAQAAHAAGKTANVFNTVADYTADAAHAAADAATVTGHSLAYATPHAAALGIAHAAQDVYHGAGSALETAKDYIHNHPVRSLGFGALGAGAGAGAYALRKKANANLVNQAVDAAADTVGHAYNTVADAARSHYLATAGLAAAGLGYGAYRTLLAPNKIKNARPAANA